MIKGGGACPGLGCPFQPLFPFDVHPWNASDPLGGLSGNIGIVPINFYLKKKNLGEHTKDSRLNKT